MVRLPRERLLVHEAYACTSPHPRLLWGKTASKFQSDEATTRNYCLVRLHPHAVLNLVLLRISPSGSPSEGIRLLALFSWACAEESSSPTSRVNLGRVTTSSTVFLWTVLRSWLFKAPFSLLASFQLLYPWKTNTESTFPIFLSSSP